ncbi:jerky protein homolog [Homalodisca vitripennis]|uniref:jerky protein homolog n=1 Tax=Homalodisca vitripennis TaxID=197043 RepID=UPI001EEA2A46|nr:jerky protein homolog [Homalodisca vitripennis]
MSLKRKRVVVSLETKLSAIKRLDKGESLKKVAADLGVAEVTVGDWRRKRKDIEQWVNKSVSDGSDLLRKTMKKWEYEQTSEELFLWFSNLRGLGSPISGPMLQAKAVEFNKRFKDGEANFSACDGWLDRWKKSNSSGSLKLRPLLIGKSKNPRAFKNIQVNCLPTMYSHQRSAWMDGQTFKEWFFHEFVRVVEAYLKKKNLLRKAILLMDNAPSHPDASELVSGDIKAAFLPPNVTSLIQPLDQGVLEAMKRHYRRRLLQVLLTWLDERITVTAALKKITVKDVSYWIASAWDDLPTELLINDEDVNEWFMQDQQMELTDDAIADMVTNPHNVADYDTDEIVEKISHSDGLKALEAALAYIEQQEESTPADVLHLQRWCNSAASKRQQKLTQKSIRDFFKK